MLDWNLAEARGPGNRKKPGQTNWKHLAATIRRLEIIMSAIGMFPRPVVQTLAYRKG